MVPRWYRGSCANVAARIKQGADEKDDKKYAYSFYEELIRIKPIITYVTDIRKQVIMITDEINTFLERYRQALLHFINF